MADILPLSLPLLLNQKEREEYARALIVAQAWHEGQVRKGNNEPYWNHVARVAATVSKIPNRTIEMIQAALLHDTLEDTKYQRDDLYWEFGPDVGSMVVWLTNMPPEKVNRGARKSMELARLSHSEPKVQTIKLADILDNLPTTDFVKGNQAFALQYLNEQTAKLGVLRAGDYPLWLRVSRGILAAQEKFFG